MSETYLRLNVWIERDSRLLFGKGLAELLRRTDELGSLKKAAESLGFSYRAAWGKLKKAEEALGEPLVTKTAGNRSGYDLSPLGASLVKSYAEWYKDVEAFALQSAQEKFPWMVRAAR